ncbi:hypothetical protein PS1_016526 [Malus domestica]
MEFHLPYQNTAIAGIFAILVLSYLIINRKSRAAASLPKAPKVVGGWPLLGHIHLLAGPELPHIVLGGLVDKYGPVFSINVGLNSALVVNCWEAAKECFTTNDLAVSSRPKIVGVEHLSYNGALVAYSPYGPYWREIRKITTHELLSNSRLELLKHVRVSEVEMSLKELYKLWIKRKGGSGEILVEMKEWFGDLTLNVVFRMVAGKRFFNVMNGSLSDEKKARRCQNVIRDMFHYIGLFVLGDAVPWLRWLDIGGHEKAMRRTAKELDSIVMEWLEEHKQRRTQGQEQDFMDVMLSVLNGADVVGFDADTVNKATCLAVIAGGSDTPMVTMTWALSLLLNNRHTLVKAQEELDKHVGRGRLVNESDISNLEYLQAIFKETLRMYPPAPLSGIRKFSADCTIGGYHVPKDTWLMMNLWKIHSDPRVWVDPMEFKPERFLTTHKDIDVKGHNFELIPFGGGRRICPGMGFALQVIQLTLASFLHAYDISTPENAAVDMTGSLGLSNVKSTPLRVLVKPRLSENIYG